MKIQSLMTKEVRSCGPDSSLDEAARIMWEFDCGCVPVTEADGSGRVVGLITDRDIGMAAYTQGRRLAEIRVRDVMSGSVHLCRPGDRIDSVAATMRTVQIRRLPVVDEAGGLLGIVSLADIVRGFVRARSSKKRGITGTQLVEAIAGICEPRLPGGAATRGA